MREHGELEFLAQGVGLLHSMVSRKELLEDRMDLDAPGSMCGGLTKVLGPGLSTEHGRVGGDQWSEMGRLLRRVQNPLVIGAQPIGHRPPQLDFSGVGVVVRGEDPVFSGQLCVRHEHPQDDAVRTRRFVERSEQIVDRPSLFAHFGPWELAVLPNVVTVAQWILCICEYVDVDVDNRGIAQAANGCTAAALQGRREL
jgi:hypothetical protein